MFSMSAVENEEVTTHAGSGLLLTGNIFIGLMLAFVLKSWMIGVGRGSSIPGGATTGGTGHFNFLRLEVVDHFLRLLS